MTIPSGKSAPTKSVQRRSLSWQYRSHQDKQSGSIQVATSGQWITSSQPMTARKLRSWTNGLTGLGLCRNYSNSPRAKWSSQPLTASGPRSPVNSMPMSWSRSWRQWQRRPRRWPRETSSTTGFSPHLEPWLEEGSFVWQSSSVVGGPVLGKIRLHYHILQHPRRPPFSTWRLIPSEDEARTKTLISILCTVRFK